MNIGDGTVNSKGTMQPTKVFISHREDHIFLLFQQSEKYYPNARSNADNGCGSNTRCKFWILVLMTFLTSVSNHIAVGALILLQGKPRKMVITVLSIDAGGQPGEMEAWHNLDWVDIFPLVNQIVRRPSVWSWSILIRMFTMVLTMIVTTPKIKIVGIWYMIIHDNIQGGFFN